MILTLPILSLVWLCHDNFVKEYWGDYLLFL